MSDRWPKIIRDPVHNIIPFDDNQWDRLLLELINAREFQRLRRIRQLGVSNFVFPGADHTRFAHSIGVMHTARMFLDRIATGLGRQITEEQRTAVLAAALLHDVGHGPFSHAFEKITGEHHEKRTREIITDPTTEVNKALRRCDPALPDIIDDFFSEDIEEASEDGGRVPAYLAQIVSSQLDADRFDYLLRDSYATGTDYGRFDLKWLLQNLFLDEQRPRFYLGHKASLAVEGYVFARYHMYRVVYFHKTTRAAEVMLRLLFKRFKELVDDAPSEEAKRSLAPGTPPSVLRVFSGPVSLDDYLKLDDCAIAEFWRCCEQSRDPLLQELGGGLLHRRLYKAIDVTPHQSDLVAAFVMEANKAIEGRGLSPEYALAVDTPGDTPYKPYDPDAEKPATQIYVENSAGKVEALSHGSGIVEVLARKYTLVRYYFPEGLRNELKAVADRKLAKE